MRTAEPGRRWRSPLPTLHITAAVGVLGSDLALGLLAVAGYGGADPQTIYPAAKMIGGGLVLPLALAALASGVALALTTGWGLFRHAWVTAKLAITLALSAALQFVLVPRLGAAAAAADRGSALVEPPLPLLLGPIGATLLILVMIALAVVKPRRKSGAVAQEA